MSTRNLLKGILVVFAAGAVIGMLYAPDKGSKTRKKLKDKKDDWKDKYEELRDTVKGKFDSAKKLGKDLTAKGRESLEMAKEEAEHLAWVKRHSDNQHIN